MATAVSMSPAEAAQAVLDQATKAAAEANSKLEYFAGQRRALEQQVATLTEKYNAACKAFAGGDGVDPGPARDELNRAESRLHGTVQLHEEWNQTAQPLSMRLRQSELRLAWQKQQDELAGLLKAELDAKAVALSSQVR
jgi:hypothetical protein